MHLSAVSLGPQNPQPSRCYCSSYLLGKTQSSCASQPVTTPGKEIPMSLPRPTLSRALWGPVGPCFCRSWERKWKRRGGSRAGFGGLPFGNMAAPCCTILEVTVCHVQCSLLLFLDVSLVYSERIDRTMRIQSHDAQRVLGFGQTHQEVLRCISRVLAVWLELVQYVGG